MGWKRRLVLAICVVCLFFLFPQKIDAMNYDIKSIYYYGVNDGVEELNSKEIQFFGNFNEEQKAFIIFSILFENDDEMDFPCIPQNVEVLNVFFIDNTIFLNLSIELLNYGGTEYERILVSQILKTAASFKGVNELTLLVNGETVILPEGTEINNYFLHY